MISTAGIAARVAGDRAEVAADPESHDGDLDVILWLVEDSTDRTWTPSEIARALGIETVEADRHLRNLLGLQFITSTYRGAWSRYGSRYAA